ncbi:CAP domain-containing protein [Cypionkella sp.]|uniref:CAP domain-containing protein n=1 Tax=Cypionkella sp. TaxID=2811411 RepID=UPI00272642B1|nr:CAP domain-containing protein [Cypionkella sp.]MDO8984522.1 CAP domain-containing protein [Cypionkella sp.]MDP2047467.1 CAP domain-containing protein [Cypionkella sp.]
MLKLGMLKAAVLLAVLTQPVWAGAAEDQVLAAVNKARAGAGCSALTVNAKLVAAAKGHAKAMAEQNFFGHASKNGAKFSSRIKAQGYRFSKVAENIGAGQSAAVGIMQDWMDSAGHRKNILDCALSETGIAVVYQPDDAPLKGQKYAMKYYWVEVFARP